MMADRTSDRSPASDRRLDELAFLHEIAQLATLARDWDELMRSIVDGTTVAMGVEVCSFYLADHEKTRLTLAATNGLDRTQVGKVSLAWVRHHRSGGGVRTRSRSRTSPRRRFAWSAGSISRTAGCCRCRRVARRVVGVLNVRPARSLFTTGRSHCCNDQALPSESSRRAVAAEVEARLAELTASMRRGPNSSAS
jgi:hypothetical protein